MKFKSLFVLIVVVFAIAANVNAATYTGSVEYTAGSGSNQATIAIDFDFGNSFLFNYQWDGIATGWDALNAIDMAGALVIDAIWYGEMAAHFVSDFDYTGGLEYDYGSAYAGWAYYGSVNNETWALKSGVDSRTLVNGCYDSWVWTNYDLKWIAIRQPGQMPIPEPVTILLFGLGGLLIRKYRA